jgi:hypothetical protein
MAEEESIIYDQHDEEQIEIHEKLYHKLGQLPRQFKDSRSRNPKTQQRHAIQDISPIKYE